MAQVVYKELSAKFSNPNDFDLWLMKNLAVLGRHVQLLMGIAERKNNPAPPTDEPDPSQDNPNPDYDPDYVPPDDDIPF